MPDISLAQLTDAYPQQQGLPVEQPYTGGNLGPLQPVTDTPVGNTTTVVNTPAPAVVEALSDPRSEPIPDSVGTKLSHIKDKLLGLNGEERYQTWPERMVREGLTAPGDYMTSDPISTMGLRREDITDRPEPGGFTVTAQPIDNSIESAMSTAALAGTGGLAGTTDATLGSAPFLRPALKYGDKIYKAPINGQHLDALPAHLAEDFQTKAMNGEDINHYNFGFMNHKGQFLDREKALDYAVKEGLVDPSAGQYGALTSTLLSDSSKPGMAIEALKGQPFYSAVEHQVNQIQQPKMTGDQWLGTLANKPGVKPEEMQWTGLQDFLKEKGSQPVTKAEVQEHLQNNKVELKEVNKSDKINIDPIVKYLHESMGPATKHIVDAASIADARKFNSHFRETTKGMSDEEVLAAARASEKLEGVGDSKYHSYQLPGGENYREKLLTLPPKKADTKGWTATKYNEGSYTVKDAKGNLIGNYVGNDTPEAAIAHAEKYNREAPEIANKTNYRSSHWDEPNILAHVRMNDRMIDGKKSLHLEEIQSDWHQQGREKGFIDSKKPYEIFDPTTAEVKGKFATEAEAKEAVKGTKLDYGKSQGVPDAPFKKTWHELALKRMIREAAEKGYDRLSWTPGEAQAARYDLSKSIDKLAYDPERGHLQGFKSNIMVMDNLVTKDKLPDFIGKEAAKKLLERETEKGGYKFLENADLKIGGEGMKGFYDQIIPKALEKISGEKVKTAELPGKLSNKMGQPPEITKVHYIDIPQSLKDKALGKGFPLFSSTHMFTPVVGNPFLPKKDDK